MEQEKVARATSFIGSQIDERSTVFGTRIAKSATELRGRLREAPIPAPLLALSDRGTSLLEGAARYLQEGTAETFVRDLETLTRKRPFVMTGGAVAAGFLAARFLKTAPAKPVETLE